MAVLLANNVFSTLVGGLSIDATSLVVAPGTGAKFPSPSAPDYFYATITSPVGEVEIVKVTSRVNDVLTVTRAQDNTTAKAFLAGSRIEVRVNAQSVLDAVNDLHRFTYSATYNPPSLADGAGVTTTVASTGAALGDFVLPSFSLDLQGVQLTAYVSAADTVLVRFQNETGASVDLGSGTLRVRVLK